MTSGISLCTVLNFYIKDLKGEVVRRQDKNISDPNLIERVIQKGTVVHIAMMDGDVERFEKRERTLKSS